jgi:hypothetical protein
MAVVISPAHLARMFVIKSASRRSGCAKRAAEQATSAHTLTHTHTFTQDRANDRALPTPGGHPGHGLHACIIHASSRAVLDVIAISSPGPVRHPLQCVLLGRVHPNGNCTTTAPSCAVAADRSYTAPVCGVLLVNEAVFLNLRTVPGPHLGDMLRSGRLSLHTSKG